jgi:TPR repeat protein
LDVMKRIEANDPVAMCQMSLRLCDEENYSVALEYFTKAAELGDEEAHYNLASIYGKGKVLRRTRKRKYSILKRLQLVVIPQRGTFLDVKNWTITRSREQRNIS